MKFFLLLTVFLTILTVITRYLISRIYDGSKCRKLLKIMLYLDIVSIFAMPLCYKLIINYDWIKYIIQLITVFFMTQLLFDGLAMIVLLYMAIYRRASKNSEFNAERRRLIKAVIPAVATIGSLYATGCERINTVVNRLSIPIKDLPDNLRGVTIAQLSDVHLGPYFNLQQLEELMEQVVSLQPDILVLTGDIFDDGKQNVKAIKLIDSYVDKFEKGIYYCYGNHEHFRGITGIKAALSQTKINVLNNVNHSIDFADDKLYLAGVDYPMKREEFEKFQELFTKNALKDIPENAVTILLAHHPDFFDSASARGVQLTLSGHTHGGQIGFMGIPLVPPLFRYMRGLYRDGDNFCYVHSGNGSWFPYRLGCPPEIAVFTLENKL